VIQHLLSHWLGLVHLLTAVAALLFGAGVLFFRKGTRRHRRLGRCYLVSMLALNFTALLIYEVFDGFGVFHWLALFSLASVLGGYQAVWRKFPGWKVPHAHFMVGSYVGLVAAAVAEVASRVPGWSFGASVIISSAVALIAGVALMMKLLPRVL
jgi:uncharacterized membrane protein